MRSRSRADGGAAAAEFAVALPAVVLVLAAVLAGVAAGAIQVRAQDAAGDAARLIGRGDGEAAVAAQLGRQLPEASWSASRSDGLVCVAVSAPAPGPMAALRIAASSCALDDG